MIFHRSRIKPNVINKVVIDNHELTQVNSDNYLGVIIDHKLNWIEHISYVMLWPLVQCLQYYSYSIVSTIVVVLFNRWRSSIMI